MSVKIKKCLWAFALLLATPLSATDGYFSTGYGLIQQGHGGAGIAFPQDALAAATNPAGIVFAGNRFDIGLTWFQPIRGGTITGSGYPGVNGSYDANRKKNFFIPELGYNHLLNPKVAVGVAIFGNGGMDTAYTTPIPLLGSRLAGVDLTQLFVAPTVAFQANAHNAFGISLNVGYQRFSASGTPELCECGFFECSVQGDRLSAAVPSARESGLGRLRNHQQDSERGSDLPEPDLDAEIRQIPRSVRRSGRVRHSRECRRRHSAEGPSEGDDSVRCRAHFLRTGEVDGGSDFPIQAPLGAGNGPAFGWHDITAEKVGFDFKLSSKLTLRAGYNHSGLPFDANQTFFNLLAPAVVKQHFSAGASLGAAQRQGDQHRLPTRLRGDREWRELNPGQLRRRRGQPAHASKLGGRRLWVGEVN